MKTKTLISMSLGISIVVLTLALPPSSSAASFGTAFTYQGRLTSGTNISSGIFDFRFSLWDAAGGGGLLIGTTQSVTAVAVSNGLFTTTLDFGSGAFNGAARYLELAVRTNGSGSFGTLSPRQPITPTPYALAASNLSGTVPASQLTGTLPSASFAGTYGSSVALNNAGNSFSGNGSGLTGVNASLLSGYSYCALPCYWNLLGNAGTTPGVNFVGTTDNKALDFRVNNQRALRIEPTTNSPNVIGGYSGNYVMDSLFGATIGGGGASNRFNLIENSTNFFGPPYEAANFSTISGGTGNSIRTAYSTIGGGLNNSIVLYGIRAGDNNTICGGNSNTLEDTTQCTIAGGSNNSMSGDIDGVYASFIGGGINNQINGTGEPASSCSIAGGANNVIVKTDCAAIGGGRANGIFTESFNGTIGGGLSNTIDAFSRIGTIGGGFANHIGMLSDYATISGGFSNIVSPGNDFAVRESYATIPGGRENTATNYAFAAGRQAKAIHDGTFVWADDHALDFPSTNANSFSVRATGGARFVSAINGTTGNPTAGVVLQPGAGSWTTLSDRESKENLSPVSGHEVLERLSAVPIATWNYKAQDKSIRHIGPMAQDFAKAFNVGEDDRGISTVDADGVAFAAIKGLNEELREKDARIRSLEEQMAELKTLVKNLAGNSEKNTQ